MVNFFKFIAYIIWEFFDYKKKKKKIRSKNSFQYRKLLYLLIKYGSLLMMR